MTAKEFQEKEKYWNARPFAAESMAAIVFGITLEFKYIFLLQYLSFKYKLRSNGKMRGIQRQNRCQ